MYFSFICSSAGRRAHKPSQEASHTAGKPGCAATGSSSETQRSIGGETKTVFTRKQNLKSEF